MLPFYGGMLKGFPDMEKSLFKSSPVERLEQVIQRVDLEGLQGKGVVGRDKDNEGKKFWRDGLDHSEPVDLRHLNIEKEHIRAVSLERRNRISAVGTLADNFEVGFIREK